MIDAVAKTQHNRFVSHVDRLQRQIVAVHRLLLDDLVAFAGRHLSRQGGRAYLDPQYIQRRLNELQAHVAGLMRRSFTVLVFEGGKAGRTVIEAGIRQHVKGRRHREAEDDSTGSDPPEGSADSLFSRPWDEPSAEVPDEGRAIVDALRLPPITHSEAHDILYSYNPNGNTWAEQLAMSSKRVADPHAMALALSEGTEEGLTLPKLRAKIQPLVEGLSNSAQRVARTEGLRVALTSQQLQYDKADAAGVKIEGMIYHCAMGPHSREEHKKRNGWFYAKTGPGVYIHEDPTEVMPQCPWAPNCQCYCSPRLQLDSEIQAMIHAIHRRDEEKRKAVT